MNRIDRLVATVLLLQSRKIVRARDIAAHFEISTRTVYRDVRALCEAGVPIAAEAGEGYSLVEGYHLPPVMFTTSEASALFLGGNSTVSRNFAEENFSACPFTGLPKPRPRGHRRGVTPGTLDVPRDR